MPAGCERALRALTPFWGFSLRYHFLRRLGRVHRHVVRGRSLIVSLDPTALPSSQPSPADLLHDDFA